MQPDPSFEPDIPEGEYCYRVVPLAEGKSVLVPTAEFGRSQREASCHSGLKRVLCPHWQETDHGTIRCNRLEVEAVLESGDYRANVKKAAAHFGGKENLEKVRGSATRLTDEIKICGINEDDPDDQPWTLEE